MYAGIYFFNKKDRREPVLFMINHYIDLFRLRRGVFLDQLETRERLEIAAANDIEILLRVK